MKDMFDPDTIAVVGSSDREGKVGKLVFDHLRSSGRKIFPVNPSYTEIEGIRCYGSVMEIDEPIDLCVICTPAEVAVANVRECVARGVKYVIPVAGGFGETGERGRELEYEIRKGIEKTPTRVLGPNTLGIYVPGKLDTMFLDRGRSPRPGEGKIALVSQSGATAATIMNSANLYSIGFSAFVGLGNRIDLDENDFIEYFSHDDKTGSIALYLESFSSGMRFREVVSGCEKPLVLLKAGRSEAGAKAAASHTGSLSGSGRIINGLCDQYGITRAYDEEELIDFARVLANSDPFSGDMIAVVTTAGGHGVIATDYIESKERGIGLRLAELSEGGRKELKKLALPFASLKNPVDLTASADDGMYARTLEILMEDPNVDAILASVLFDPPGMSERLVDIVKGLERKKPLVVYTVGAEMSIRAINEFEKAGIPAYPSIWRGVRALGALHGRGRFLEGKNG